MSESFISKVCRRPLMPGVMPLERFRMVDARYILLYRDGRRLRAADATHLLDTGEFPQNLRVGECQYRRLDNEDTFIFWDEFRDASGRTVGYSFLLPESPTFANASLWRDTENAVVEGDEVRLLLEQCSEPVWECVQGFGSEFYQSTAHPTDCMLLMSDFTENPAAFEFSDGPNRQRVIAA
jgi:hypothetical protein